MAGFYTVGCFFRLQILSSFGLQNNVLSSLLLLRLLSLSLLIFPSPENSFSDLQSHSFTFNLNAFDSQIYVPRVDFSF